MRRYQFRLSHLFYGTTCICVLLAAYTASGSESWWSATYHFNYLVSEVWELIEKLLGIHPGDPLVKPLIR